MSATSRVLQVPYHIQPTSITCQSTVLKMMAQYLEQYVLFQSTGAGESDIQDIWKDINESPDRPSNLRNAHKNMKWWLEKHFPTLSFQYIDTKDEQAAMATMVASIDRGFPVLVSVSHARVKGHIVLVVGYQGYTYNACPADFKLVVHDPYGQFDPSLLSNLYGKRRTDGAACLTAGGESGPGKDTLLEIEAASRQRKGDDNKGTFYLLFAQ